MQGILTLPIPPLDSFLNLRANLLVTSHPKKLCCKFIDHKNYILCGTWSCRSNSIKSVVTLSSFTDNRVALTGRRSSKPSNKHQRASCHIAFISRYASFHGCVSHTSCWGKGRVHIRDLFVSPRMFWCNRLSHFTFSWPPFHRWPVIQNTGEILSLLDLREADEKRHDAGKCHICVTDWNTAARIHYSVSNRPTDITLGWTLLKRSAIRGFPTAGGGIYCHSPGVGEGNTSPCVPTRPMEMQYITTNTSTFCFMEDSA